ncbi:ergothioneine biosynthesis protein EgtB [Microbulbifer sp. OS29]|uniref:Ergothioneine biosynthesis protein EgtB n=1 Tax=Microbulbifer okhotskensis TaxID=2926617 RepID=A0A9X2EME6_9GAMM|nr:ergothioneine biosynthesis protein EgtB [Microbulbifer okhotskensis]MCO1334344.1 ergothioneine biosynthesis protein EgtB [Microbulbifer okhotskensis]
MSQLITDMAILAGEVPLEEVQDQLLSFYQKVRGETEGLAASLSAEDMQLQSMPDASPTKWHLAHTSWFFETFVLASRLPGYQVFNPHFNHLFNSYYNSLGTPFSRSERGLISRPDLGQIYEYRKAVDVGMQTLLSDYPVSPNLASLIQLGLNHEQQHQELILTDIKHALSVNPMALAYSDALPEDEGYPLEPLRWLKIPRGFYGIGSDGNSFCFDNERPEHQQFVDEFRIASRLITNGEYLEFIQDGGYEKHRLWLSDGWSLIQQNQYKSPCYWRRNESGWQQYSLHGSVTLNRSEPVYHLSFYEADAFATWAGKRLPTEFEWEAAACHLRRPDQMAIANFLEKRHFKPLQAQRGHTQFLGDLWEWTSSAYLPYRRFRTRADAVGEYNGKFMCNQKVLRGGSFATPADHIRISYRNFFYPHQSWQFTGIRLAGD